MMIFNASQQNFTIENSTASPSVDVLHKFPLSHGTAIVVINSILSFIGTFGNFLIILAILYTPQLRKRKSNFLLLSLAIADLIVTMIAQPFFTVSIGLKTYAHRCNQAVDMGYMMTTPLSGMSSTNHLAAISVDRAISIVKPHQHRDFINKWFKKILFTCWFVAAVLSGLLTPFFQVVIIITEILLLLCLSTMICSYGMIIYKLKFAKVHTDSAITSNARDRAIEKRVSGAAAIIILLFTMCYMPHIAFHLSFPGRKFLCTFDVAFSWIRTFLLANSSMNFIVYSLRIRHFRHAYLRILGYETSIMSTTDES